MLRIGCLIGVYAVLAGCATASDVMDMIFTASRERNLTVLYVTHDEQLAREAHRSLRLTDRRVVAV